MKNEPMDLKPRFVQALFPYNNSPAFTLNLCTDGEEEFTPSEPLLCWLHVEAGIDNNCEDIIFDIPFHLFFLSVFQKEAIPVMDGYSWEHGEIAKALFSPKTHREPDNLLILCNNPEFFCIFEEEYDDEDEFIDDFPYSSELHRYADTFPLKEMIKTMLYKSSVLTGKKEPVRYFSYYGLKGSPEDMPWYDIAVREGLLIYDLPDNHFLIVVDRTELT